MAVVWKRLAFFDDITAAAAYPTVTPSITDATLEIADGLQFICVSRFSILGTGRLSPLGSARVAIL